MSRKIPKIIYQTFKTSELIGILKENKQSYIDLNPDYEYRFFDDDAMHNYVKNYDCSGFSFSKQQLWSAYSSIRIPVGKADLWRYLVIYDTGGIYADIDSKCIKSLDTFISDQDDIVTAIAGPSNNYDDTESVWWHLFPQWFLIYSPKNLIMKRIIEESINCVLSKQPIPDSEDCKNMLERYTGACISNYVYRKKVFNFRNLEQEKNLKCKTFTIKYLTNKYQISILPSIHNLFNDSIIEKNFPSHQIYTSNLEQYNSKHWLFEKDLFHE